MSVRILEIRFTKKKNLGNYESEEMGVTASVEEGQDPAKVAAEVKAFVTRSLDGVVNAEVKGATATKGQTETKGATTKTETAATPSKSETKTVETKGTTKADKPATTKAAKTTVSDKEVKANFAGKGEKATIKYDRNIKEHQQDLAGILVNLCGPDWRKDADVAAKASSLSKEILIGQPFKDGSGVVLPSFMSLIKETLGVGEEAEVDL